MRTDVSCGPLYRAMREHFAGDDEALRQIFAAGFVCGQAEKVYLGACSAAMFRPTPENFEALLATVHDAAENYGLLVEVLKGEIWLCRGAETAEQVRAQAQLFEVNSVGWHRWRAGLCGVVEHEVDVRFHERQGAQAECD